MSEREIRRERLVLKPLPGLMVKSGLSAVQLGVVQNHQVSFRKRAEPAGKVMKGTKAHAEKMAPPHVLYKHYKSEERNKVSGLWSFHKWREDGKTENASSHQIPAWRNCVLQKWTAQLSCEDNSAAPHMHV